MVLGRVLDSALFGAIPPRGSDLAKVGGDLYRSVVQLKATQERPARERLLGFEAMLEEFNHSSGELRPRGARRVHEWRAPNGSSTAPVALHFGQVTILSRFMSRCFPPKTPTLYLSAAVALNGELQLAWMTESSSFRRSKPWWVLREARTGR
jgi:hypothetical protein